MGTAPRGLWPFAFEAAIFDFDGTLADTAHIWYEVDVAFLSKRALPYTEDYPQRLSALGFVDGARYTKQRYGLDESVEEICAEWEQASRELYTTSVTLRPGARRYIEALRGAGIPCALATTNDRSVLEAMRHVPVRDLFDARVFGREVGRGKDHPDIYLEAARRLGVEVGRCLVFEDIVPALASAHAAGATTCGVLAHDDSQQVENVHRAADLWLEDWRDIPLSPSTSGS